MSTFRTKAEIVEQLTKKSITRHMLESENKWNIIENKMATILKKKREEKRINTN